MPRQQVYGKHSRALVCDDFAAFADSPRASRGAKAECDVDALVGGLSSLDLKAGDAQKKDVGSRGSRKALGEINGNGVVAQKKLSVRPQEKKPRKRAQKPIIQEEESTIDATITELWNKLHIDSENTNTEKEPSTEPAASTSIQEECRTQQPQTSPDILAYAPQEPSDVYTEHCSSILSLAHHPLSDFTTWAEQLSDHFHITKIAEASFGEVYRLSLAHSLTNISPADESVFKVIPLRGPESILPKDKRKRNAALRKAEMMSKPADVANEVRLLQRMSCIPGFTNFRDVRVLRGRPAPVFAEAFHSWNDSQKGAKKELSHFPDPSKKASYTDDQLWAVIEMQNAGTDLERFVEAGDESRSIWSVWDVFWQVVLSLAKGEEGAEFEHRDLHMGNVCVRRRPTSTSSEAQNQEDREIDITRKLNFTNLETTIIDYTLSRALMHDSTVAYYDLAPAAEAPLFEGDSADEYQYDIYRYMRSAMFLDDALAEYPPIPAPSNPKHTFFDPEEPSAKTWHSYKPITNLVWLHFILHELLAQTTFPSQTKKPAKRNKTTLALWTRANELEANLSLVEEFLDPEIGLCKNGFKGASELVAYAVAEGWIDVEDVVGGDLSLSEVDGADELVEQMGGLGLGGEVKGKVEEEVEEVLEIQETPVRRSPRKMGRKKY